MTTEPYDRHGDDNNSVCPEPEPIKTLDERIMELADDYAGDLEGFMNELSVINLTDKEKSEYISVYYDSADMSDLIYPLFIKSCANAKEVARLRGLVESADKQFDAMRKSIFDFQISRAQYSVPLGELKEYQSILNNKAS